MANANLFQQYLQPVKSVQDYTNEMSQAESNQLELAAKRQGVQDDMATRAAFQASGGDQANALQRLTQGGQYKAAQSLQKSMLDAQKAQSDIGLATSHAKSYESTAKKTDQEVKFAAAVDHAKALNYVKNPQDVISYFDQGIAKGVFPAEQRESMIAQANQYPTLEAWKQAELNASIPVLEKFKTDAENSRNAATNLTSRANNSDTNATSILNNKNTVNASLSNADATREVAGATRYAANAQRDQATEMKLADDYRAQSKEFGAATSAYKQISATLDSATTSPAATLAAATKFMKILDPGSVVRESELGMALQASGVIDRASNYINILQRGKVLTPTQVADFKDISQKMYSASQQVQRDIDKDYKGKAKAYGLRPEMVTQDLGQNASKVVNFNDLK